MVEITSEEELRAWLKDKPADWAQVIAARAALRVMPYAFAGSDVGHWVEYLAFPLLWKLFISWSALNFPAHDMVAAIAAAQDYASDSVFVASSEYADTSAYADAACLATYAAIETNNVSSAAKAASIFATAKAEAWDKSAGNVNAAAIWANVSHDCRELENAANITTASQLQTHKKLWPVEPPVSWLDASILAVIRLCELGEGYPVWIDWYERRIRGERAAFDIPGDTDRKEDKAILARLADATNEDFWDKGAAYVNTTLQDWIDEARARAAPPAADPAPQNPDAIVWESDGESRIGVNLQAGVDQLDTSEEAQDRHAEAVNEALAARSLCENSNAALEIKDLLDRYITAMGQSIEASRPGLLVQRGEKLRQKLSSRLADGDRSDFGPLPDQVRDALRSWQSAHNAFVGLDSALARRDSALFGPDARRGLVGPDDIRAIAASAQATGILQPGARETLDEAADIAPVSPDPEDRRSRWSSETAKNFGRQAIGFLWARFKTGAVLAGSAYGIGHWTLSNAEWFRKVFADDATMLSVLETVLHWLSKLPLT
jgi:hypothetical protein